MSRVPMNSATMGGDPREPLQERFPRLPHQGVGAELVAARYDLHREELDDFAARSHALAHGTATSGGFDAEIVPVDLADGRRHLRDETVRSGTTTDDLARLGPAFREDSFSSCYPEIQWRITAGNSSPLSDGASAVLIVSEDALARFGLHPMARFHSFAVAGSDPEIMLTGPMEATRRALRKGGLHSNDIDVFEINEAFASVPLAWAKEMDVDLRRVNPRGGAIALGHPLGASGTRIIATMVNHLRSGGGRFGLISMCEAGGMANATVVEALR
jgi:acetyl-CoA acyltransferase